VLLHLFLRMRLSCLTHIHAGSIRNKGDAICLTVDKSKSRLQPQEFWLARLPGNPAICPATAVHAYLKRSRDCRRGLTNNNNKLFMPVSIEGPIKGIQVETIRKAIHGLMVDADVPANFLAHAIRMAACSSALLLNGISEE
jgi:hypothetical protein